MKTKWVELVSAGIVAAVIVLLVLAGTQRPRGARASAPSAPAAEERGPDNVTLIAPPTVHRAIDRVERH